MSIYLKADKWENTVKCADTWGFFIIFSRFQKKLLIKYLSMLYSLFLSKCIQTIPVQQYWLLYKKATNNQRALYSKEARICHNCNAKSLNRHIVCQTCLLKECLVFWASRNSPFWVLTLNLLVGMFFLQLQCSTTESCTDKCRPSGRRN